ncbi:hypothetical protein AMATHDRAFT_66682 [Amanita thiersii Skay4041]|uniref:Globin-sensor domain-containing protein n=1 Tax=Amanita thiersii Skay4041 TaxID=703135 RepID=A0A2A9NHV2_9AGAR|nr:hypothetical protein AMATHDRAFT_66682 [Amanita thiersii Skay4041]
MQDIPASSLSSLPSRISYTRSFLEFSAEDAAALHAARPVLAPLVPVIVDMVYVKLFDYNITAQSFVPKQTGFTGSSPESLEDLKLDHPQILFRKDFLKGYIAKLVTLDYEDIKTWEYLDKVALMHTGVEFSGFKHRAKKPGLRVEYVHCGLLLGYVEDIIISEVIKHPELSPETKLVVTRAVNKVCNTATLLVSAESMLTSSFPAIPSAVAVVTKRSIRTSLHPR